MFGEGTKQRLSQGRGRGHHQSESLTRTIWQGASGLIADEFAAEGPAGERDDEVGVAEQQRQAAGSGGEETTREREREREPKVKQEEQKLRFSVIAVTLLAAGN